MSAFPFRVASLMSLGMFIGAATALSVQAQTFPSKPIRLVVANAPGGNADLVSRMAAEAISRELGNPVFVENQAGGRQIPGTNFVARSAPDGHTLLGVGLVFAINAGLYNDLPFDPLKDFAPVGLVGSTPQLILSAPSFPPNNIKELIALAKARPDTIHYSSTGIGGTGHLGGELLKSMAGIKLVHVPYKGTAQANADAMKGVIELTMAAPASVVSLIKAGRLKALAIASPRRSAQMPDVPAVAEAVPGYSLMLWNGVSAPAATPKPVIARLNTALNKGISTADLKDRLLKAGVEVDPMTPEETADFIESEITKWAKVVKEAGIRSER